MLAIRAEWGFDGERGLRGGVVVLVEEGQILAVGGPTTPVPAGVPVHDHPGATVLPGLVDCHVHLCGDGLPGALDRIPDHSPDEMDAVIETALRRQLASGVCVVRDLGDRDGAVLAWRTSAAERSVLPAIVASGPLITSPGGHCSNMGGEAAGLDGLRAAVRDRAERGADIVKIMASGGVMTPGTDVLLCQFTDEELRAVVDEAHAVGLPVTAHAHGLPSVEQVLRVGVDGIEHCSCLTMSGIQMPAALLTALAESRVVVCPTLGKAPDVVPPPAVLALMKRTGITLEARRVQMARMHGAGVRMVSGDDAGINPGKPHGILPEAVVDLVQGGVSTCDALASATSLAADACGVGASKGRLAAGYDADLLVVDGDPLTAIGALRQVSAVIRAGDVAAGRPVPDSAV